MLNNILGIIGGLLMGLSKPAKSYEMIIIGRFIIGLNCGKNNLLNLLTLRFWLLSQITTLLHHQKNQTIFILCDYIIYSWLYGQAGMRRARNVLRILKDPSKKFRVLFRQISSKLSTNSVSFPIYFCNIREISWTK